MCFGDCAYGVATLSIATKGATTRMADRAVVRMRIIALLAVRLLHPEGQEDVATGAVTEV